MRQKLTVQGYIFEVGGRAGKQRVRITMNSVVTNAGNQRLKATREQTSGNFTKHKL